MAQDGPELYSLMEVDDDGEFLTMQDGSQWEVNPGDIPTVCTWLPMASIEAVTVDSDSLYPYELRNGDASIRARKSSD